MKQFTLYILLGSLFLSKSISAQVSEAEYKVAFIERFTRFIEWPDEDISTTSDAPFIITILGNNDFGPVLTDFFKTVKIKNRNVELNFVENLPEIPKTHLLFISGSKRKELQKIISSIKSLPILTISDTEGFGESGIQINLYHEGNYIKYEMNIESLSNSGLKASSLLLASAKIINKKG